MTQKIDFKKTLDSYQAKRGVFRLVEVPPLHYLMIDGHGDPNTSPVYAEALAALFPLAYAVKFVSKNLGRDYVVMPLQGLWWADDMAAFTTRRDKVDLALDAAEPTARLDHPRARGRRPRRSGRQGCCTIDGGAPGGARRGSVRADHAPRALRRRGPGAATAARRVRARARSEPARPTP